MGVSVEADGACPYCGLRAQAAQLVQHTWRHTVKPAARKPEWWDSAGLVSMLVACAALIGFAVWGAL